jgi:hypothetical protein
VTSTGSKPLLSGLTYPKSKNNQIIFSFTFNSAELIICFNEARENRFFTRAEGPPCDSPG